MTRMIVLGSVLFAALIVGCGHAGSRASAVAADSAVVRYQIADVNRAVSFYTRLGFSVDLQNGAAFAKVSRGKLAVLLSGPGSSGARAMPDGRRQEPGGWNRIVLYDGDLAAELERLKIAGVRFRNDVEVGPGGKQILVDDPDGNLIELHEAPR